MVPSEGIQRGIDIFQYFWPTPRNPWVPHIWAPRSNFQKSLGYPTQNLLGGYHAKFQVIRPSSLFWRGSGYEKWNIIFYYEYTCTATRTMTNETTPNMQKHDDKTKNNKINVYQQQEKTNKTKTTTKKTKAKTTRTKTTRKISKQKQQQKDHDVDGNNIQNNTNSVEAYNS